MLTNMKKHLTPLFGIGVVVTGVIAYNLLPYIIMGVLGTVICSVAIWYKENN